MKVLVFLGRREQRWQFSDANKCMDGEPLDVRLEYLAAEAQAPAHSD